MQLKITLPGPPRTKKTHNRIVKFTGRDKKGNQREFLSVRPSEAYEDWLKNILTNTIPIKRQLLDYGRSQGLVKLPILNDVSVACHIYRDKNGGDLLGYLNAVADAIQEPRYTWSNGKQKKTRDGLGIIDDDVQIVAWDGSQMLLDRDRPRVELSITIIGMVRAKIDQPKLEFEEAF